MKLLTIICGESIEDEIVGLLKELAIKGYTVISGVRGIGQTATLSEIGKPTGQNTIYLVALDDAHIDPLVTGVRELHDRMVQERHGHEVPLKSFIQTCELIV